MATRKPNATASTAAPTNSDTATTPAADDHPRIEADSILSNPPILVLVDADVRTWGGSPSEFLRAAQG